MRGGGQSITGNEPDVVRSNLYGIDKPSRQTYSGTINTGNSGQSPRAMGPLFQREVLVINDSRGYLCACVASMKYQGLFSGHNQLGPPWFQQCKACQS